MLFSSFEFLFAFLPVALLGYHWLATAGYRQSAKLYMTLASLFFYGWWDPAYLPLVLGSIAVNFGLGLLMARQPDVRRAALTVGLVFNLSLLGYYKYANFFVTNFDALTGLDLTIRAIVLPIGISFFTFQQIAYLIEVKRDGRPERDIINYSLFILFFPHLIAGPITHHREMLPQFRAAGQPYFDPVFIRIGLPILVIGLAKKVLIADTIATLANPVFTAADAGQGVSAAAAWLGLLAYTFQLYFDFSGYSDMAIGIGLLFGIRLPVNFASPYKSTSMTEFWRRWHITLSRFLRDYLYIPLGGNRRGPTRRYVNLLATMMLGGFWHGAGWNFLAWGTLHGLYLVVNHLWTDRFRGTLPACPRPLGWALTFFGVIVAWALFRATTFGGAVTIIGGLVGLDLAPGATVALATPPLAWLGVAVAAAIAFRMPNTLELVGYPHSVPGAEAEHAPLAPLTWRPRPVAVAAALGLVAALAVAKLPDPGVFLYFNF